MPRWHLSDIPDLSGKVAIVTGGNVGLGFKSALELAHKGAEVVIACRRADSGQEAIEKIRADVPGATLCQMTLDLANLASVADFAAEFSDQYDRLDRLSWSSSANPSTTITCLLWRSRGLRQTL